MDGTFLGEIKRARDISRDRQGYTKWIWLPCCDCGKERWVQIFKVGTNEIRCKRCKGCGAKLKGKNMKAKTLTGIPGANSQGGRFKNNYGYIQIKVYPNDFFYQMADKNGYVGEHRLVVAKALGRCLHSWELVHHKGVKYPNRSIENKQDNRYPENLQLVTDERHKQITILENRIDWLEKRVTLLEAENTLLKVREPSLVNLNKIFNDRNGYLSGFNCFWHNRALFLCLDDVYDSNLVR